MAKNCLDHPLMWEDSSNYLFLNSKMPAEEVACIQKSVSKQSISASIWLKSSGTEKSEGVDHKVVALSKKSVLWAAGSVNKLFQITDTDSWLNPLPVFHIGGLAIYARSYLSGSKVEASTNEKWSASSFVQTLMEKDITLTSLVPTQVFDLVKGHHKAPSSLRYIFVGGGHLHEDLYLQARKLGWPLILSYGMTETAAMLATSSPESLSDLVYPSLKTLPHIELSSDGEGVLIRSQSLLAGYLLLGRKEERWVPFDGEFRSDDRVELNGDRIKVLGRSSDLVKILGESVDIARLEKKVIQSVGHNSLSIVALPEERRGYELVLVSDQEISSSILSQFNQEVLPFERLSSFKKVDEMPRTTLGKLIKTELLEKIK